MFPSSSVYQVPEFISASQLAVSLRLSVAYTFFKFKLLITLLTRCPTLLEK